MTTIENPAAELFVSGMTCGHCVASVTSELTSLTGVTHVSVDLVHGGASRVVVHSRQPLDRDALHSAVEDAGYTISAAS